MTIYSLEVLLSQFWTSLLFRVQFWLLLLDWPAYRFLRRQVRWSGIPISLRISHSLLWSTQSAFIPIPKKGNAKECSDCCTIALISHTSKVMLKILQARFQQYVNCELWNSICSSWVYKRQRNQRSNCQLPLDHQKSKRVPEKHLFLLYWLCQSLWLCGSQQNVENS